MQRRSQYSFTSHSALERQRQTVEDWEGPDDNPFLPALAYIASCMTAQAVRSVVS